MPENEGPSTYLNANEEPFDTEAEWKGLGYVKEAQEVRQERQRLRPEESGQQGACHRAFWRHGDSRNAAAGLRGREPERVSALLSLMPHLPTRRALRLQQPRRRLPRRLRRAHLLHLRFRRRLRKRRLQQLPRPKRRLLLHGRAQPRRVRLPRRPRRPLLPLRPPRPQQRGLLPLRTRCLPRSSRRAWQSVLTSSQSMCLRLKVRFRRVQSSSSRRSMQKISQIRSKASLLPPETRSLPSKRCA